MRRFGMRRCSSEDIFECRTNLDNLYGVEKNKYPMSTSFDLQRSNSADISNQDRYPLSHQNENVHKYKKFLRQTSSIDEETPENTGKA